MAQVGIYENLPGSMAVHHHNLNDDGGFLWFDIRAAGAKVDGTTDDTIAVQAAFNGLTSGGTVFFPVGTCLTQRLLPIDNVRILGAGWGSKIKLKDGAESDLIYVQNKTGVIVENIFLDGNKAGQAGATFHVLKFDGCTDCYFNNIYVQNGAYANVTVKDSQRVFGNNIFSKNPKSVGLYLVGTTADSIIRGINHQTDSGGASGYHGVLLYNGVTDCEISDIFVRATGIRLSGVTFNVNCHRNKLIHGRFIGCENGVEINLSDYWELEDIFSDNNLEGLGAESGIEIINSHYGRFSGGILRRNVGAGIYFHDGSHDNTISTVLAELNGWSGFYVNGSIRNKFTGCKGVKNSGRNYLIEAASNDTTLEGCDGLDAGQGGDQPSIEIANSNYCLITGGDHLDDQGTKTQTYGVRETGTSNYTQCRGVNALASRNKTGSISLTGAQSVKSDCLE